MKKKVLAVLLGGCMVAGMLAGCGGDNKEAADSGSDKGGDKGGNYQFEVVVKSFQSTYWQAAKQGIDAASKELGVKCNTTGPNAESDIADQVNMLNNAINKAPNGIALAACDQSSVLKSLQTALDKKIPVVCFDTGIADAPEGSVYATVVTNNEEAGGIAAEKMYEALKDQIANAKDTVRIGEVNQDATSGNITGRGMGFINKFKELAEADGKKVAVVGANAKDTVRIGEVNQDATSGNITGRGMGFINKFKELAEADGKKVAVVGNEYYVNLVENNAKEADADIIIEVAVPAQTTVELSATEASNIMNKKDTIAMFGSNQVTAEGLLTADIIIEVAVPAQTTVELSATEASNIMNKKDTIAMFGSNQVTAEGLLTANQNLDVLGSGDGKILGVGFDAGSTQKAAVKDGVLLGSVTQAPVDQGRIAIETLFDICEGKEVKDVETACYWYDAETMEDAEIAPNLYD